jgi:F5/8 type C domain-containing protein/glycosyl hydrolase family 42 (putative beta-galactosidase)
LRYVWHKAPSYTTGLSEIRVFSESKPGVFPKERNIANLAFVETSHRRYRPGVVSKAVDGDVNTFWHAGPYAHLFLRFGSPVRVSRIGVHFGDYNGRCSDYLIQARQNGVWRTVKSIYGNDNIDNTHIFMPYITVEGIRFIPLTTAQISETLLGEIEVFSYDTPKPYKAFPDEWAKVLTQKNKKRHKPFGIYAVDHWRDFFPLPEGLFIDGVEYYALWKDLEPSKGSFDWAPIDEALYECGKHDQKVILKFLAGSYCPDWIYTQSGVPKVVSAKELKKLNASYDPPVYWDEKYLKVLSETVHELGGRYDGNANIDSVIMSLAGTGEMGRFWSLPQACWDRAGYTDQVFTDACKKIIDIYCGSFKKTPLICQISYIASNGSATPALLVARYAAEKGVMVEQATLDDLMGSSKYKCKSVEGPVSYIDIYNKIKTKTGISTEANTGYVYNQSKSYPSRFSEVLWQAFLNSLGLGVEHISIYPGDLLQPKNKELIEFARRRLGKGVADTPSAWINFRGAPLENPAVGIELIEGAEKTIAPSKLVKKRLCRRTDIANGAKAIELKLSHVFLGRIKDGMKVRVIYLDSGKDQWTLRYNENGIWKKAPLADKFRIDAIAGKDTVRKNDSGVWREAVFILPTLVSNTPTQLKIDAGDEGDEYIHFLEVANRHARLENILNSLNQTGN